jgi:hypothetical protein
VVARMVGVPGPAEVALAQALAFAPAGENYSWAKAVPPYVEVLVRLGRVSEAVAFAEGALAECARLDIASVYRRQIEMSVAMAWAAQGQHARAARCLDQMLASAGAEQVRGIALAVLEEARARVALLCGDAGGFERASQGVARVFANHDDPTLVARYRRLMDDAMQEHGLLDRHAFDSEHGHAPALEQSVADIRERIDHTTSHVRLQRALELLIEHCEAKAGHLFVMLGTEVQCVASAGETASESELEEFVRSARSSENDFSGGTTARDAGLDQDVTRLCRFTSHAGVAYDSVPLHRSESADGTASSVAILRPKNHMLRRPAPDFLCALVRALLDTGDLAEAASIHTTPT